MSRHGTLHTRDISSKDNTANDNIPKQSLDVVGLKDLEILHTQIFANHLEFGNNGIVVWEAMQLKPCIDMSRVCSVPCLDTNRT